MKRIQWLLAFGLALLVLAGAITLRPRSIAENAQGENLPEGCSEATFEQDDFIVCTVDPAKQRIDLRWKDVDGRPYEHLNRIKLESRLVFAMNGGMYHEDLSPVGLYVEDGVQVAPINLGDAPGNFFLKPNGVFFIDDQGRPGVRETTAYAATGMLPRWATQSGPMLVVDGEIHPRFEPDGQSRNVRNGVGVDAAGRAVFAVSRKPVSFGKFARLFRDGLDCRNALFLDGAISALHDGHRYIVGGQFPVGPIIVVSKRGE